MLLFTLAAIFFIGADEQQIDTKHAAISNVCSDRAYWLLQGPEGQLISPPEGSKIPDSFILLNKEADCINILMINGVDHGIQFAIRSIGSVEKDGMCDFGIILRNGGRRVPKRWDFVDDEGNPLLPPHDIVISDDGIVGKRAQDIGIVCEFTINNEIVLPVAAENLDGYGYYLKISDKGLEIYSRLSEATRPIAVFSSDGRMTTDVPIEKLSIETLGTWKWLHKKNDEKFTLFIPPRGTVAKALCPLERVDCALYLYDWQTGELVPRKVITVD